MAPSRADRAAADQSLADAREALAFWQRRCGRLAWHRRAARAEARDHIDRWHEHIVTAQLERFGLARTHPLAPLVGSLALPPREQVRRLTRLVLRTRPARYVRRLLVVTAVLCVAAVVLSAVVLGQLL